MEGRPRAYHSNQSNQALQAGPGIQQTHAQLGINIPTVPYKIANYLQPGGITINQIDDFIASNQMYDPLWIQRLGVNLSIFDTYTSNNKWTDFFSKVFHVGDRFDFSLWVNGQQVQKSATVSNMKKDWKSCKISPTNQISGGEPTSWAASHRGLPTWNAPP